MLVEMDIRLLAALLVSLVILGSVRTAAGENPTGSGSGGDGEQSLRPAEDEEEDANITRSLRCRRPVYSDPSHIETVTDVDYERLAVEGRCYLACTAISEVKQVMLLDNVDHHTLPNS